MQKENVWTKSMKIVHVCLCGPMTDGMNYQENILTKYHKRMGLDVTVIASQWIWGSEGKLQKTEKSNYTNIDGVKIVRLKTWYGDVNNPLKIYKGLYGVLENEQPDYLFVHDCQFLDLIVIAKYLRQHKNVITYVDNHSDSMNSASSWLSKNVLHKLIWKSCIWKIAPYVKRFYGVLPARVEFLKSMYGLPDEKCELLVMGADDDLVKKAVDPSNRTKLRQKLNLSSGEFLIVTGGKINRYRPETLNLMRAVIHSDMQDVRLLVFGSVDDILKDEFDQLVQNPRIMYIGWLDSAATYDYMAIADLVIFPGLHSVMWEQAVALGIPCVFKKIEGFMHVDLGGNALFLENSDEEEISGMIAEIHDDQSLREHMRSVAECEGGKFFLYSEIAKNSIRDDI